MAPTRIRLCRSLAEKRVPLSDVTPETLEEVVGALGQKVGCEVTLWGGVHGEVVHPRFRCDAGASEYVNVERSLRAGT